MTTKNFFGGAIINYGATLPTTTGVPDGAVFFKTSAPDAGLYVFNFVSDTNPSLVGDQAGQLWTAITGPSVSLDANTLDGLDSTAFQLVSPVLTGVIDLGAATGVMVKTGASTFATKTISAANTTIAITNGTGTAAGDIQVAVNQANLSLNSIGGILSLAKGGTGTNLSITQGGVIYGATTTTLASTGAGTAGWLLRSGAPGAPSWVDPTTLVVAEAGQAVKLKTGRNINGVLFTGESNITVTANTTNSISFNSTGTGAASGTSFNGSVARTISYNTISAAAMTGINATGTWPISITGSANSATTATSALTAGSANTLTTPRNFSITGGATAAAVAFDGSGVVALNVTSLDATSLAGTIAAARLSGSYTINITGAASNNVLKTGADTVVGPLTSTNSVTVGTTGSVRLSPGDSTYTGAISFRGANAVQQGAIYSDTLSGSLNGGTIVYEAANHKFVGGPVNANSSKIINVAYPTQPLDAVNLAAMQQAFQGTTNSFFTEGFWTPQLYFGGAQGVATYTTAAGRWFKMGTMVFLMGYIQIGTKTAATGEARIRGNPWSVDGYWPGTISSAGAVSLTGVLSAGVNSTYPTPLDYIDVRMWGSTGDGAFANNTNFANGTIIQVTTWFKTTGLLASQPVSNTVDFSASPVSGTAGVTSFVFTGTTTGFPVVSRLWNFGDGTDATTSPAVKTYSASGTYTVSYSATFSNGQTLTETKTNYITVSPFVGGGGGSVSTTAYLPSGITAVEAVQGSELSLLNETRDGIMRGTVISNRVSTQNLVTLVSESGIELTCSDNTPLTLQDGSAINSLDALGVKLPVYDSNGFRWETITEVRDAGQGQVSTIFCRDQCYAAGDAPDRFIFTHNVMFDKE